MLRGWQCLLAAAQSLPAPKISESIIFFRAFHLKPSLLFRVGG